MSPRCTIRIIIQSTPGVRSCAGVEGGVTGAAARVSQKENGDIRFRGRARALVRLFNRNFVVLFNAPFSSSTSVRIPPARVSPPPRDILIIRPLYPSRAIKRTKRAILIPRVSRYARAISATSDGGISLRSCNGLFLPPLSLFVRGGHRGRRDILCLPLTRIVIGNFPGNGTFIGN